MSGIFGEVLTFSQENGPEVRLRVFGDEHYSRYEDIKGFTVVYDDDAGYFCFADLLGNRLTSSGVGLDREPPSHLVRHLQESSTARQAAVEGHRLSHSAEASALETVVRTFGPNQGLLAGRRLSIGAVRGLTILVNFQDVASTTTAADVEEMVNGADYTRNGNISSVREYFLQVSNNHLDYTNTVVGPFTLSQNRHHYVNNLLVEEALDLAVASGLDLTQFDSRGEGIIDALNILYAGRSLYQGDLWPHNSSINLQRGAVRTNLYLLTGLGRNPSELSIGTFCHENGHLLCRFPDMYDYGNRDGDDQDSAGIGYYCLMGSGNHLDFGRSPAPVCAYLRDLAGWCDTVVELNEPGNYQAPHGNYGEVMKYRSSKPNEYFIVENRSKIGLDRAGPSSGLAVYHCDIFGSNEFQQGTANRHYQCALLQADGRRDLESGVNNPGDANDLFGAVAGIALSSVSAPNSREWDGRDSGLIISDIGASGEQIDFQVGQVATSQTVTGESTPGLDIPDNQSAGVWDVINIAEPGIVRRIRVSVEITHTYIGDLEVRLYSPTFGHALLHARAGRSQDDLMETYDSDSPGQLTTLVGLPMQGAWTIHVADREARDLGKLQKWSIEIESA